MERLLIKFRNCRKDSLSKMKGEVPRWILRENEVEGVEDNRYYSTEGRLIFETKERILMERLVLKHRHKP